MKIPETADSLIDAAAEEAALLAFLLYLGSPLLGEKIRQTMANPKTRTLHEIATSIGFPPTIFRICIVYLAKVAQTPGDHEQPTNAPDTPSGKAQLDAIVKASPIDMAMTETIRRFASVSFHNRAKALEDRSAARTVEEIAAILGLQVASVQMEIGAALAQITGETVEIPLGAPGNGAIMQMRPSQRPTLQ